MSKHTPGPQDAHAELRHQLAQAEETADRYAKEAADLRAELQAERERHAVTIGQTQFLRSQLNTAHREFADAMLKARGDE